METELREILSEREGEPSVLYISPGPAGQLRSWRQLNNSPRPVRPPQPPRPPRTNRGRPSRRAGGRGGEKEDRGGPGVRRAGGGMTGRGVVGVVADTTETTGTTETPGGMTTTGMTTETETTTAPGRDTGTADTLTIITTTSPTTTDLWLTTAGLGGAGNNNKQDPTAVEKENKHCPDLCTELAVCLREISRVIRAITTTSECHTPGDRTVTWGTTGVINTVSTLTWDTMAMLTGAVRMYIS